MCFLVGAMMMTTDISCEIIICTSRLQHSPLSVLTLGSLATIEAWRTIKFISSFLWRRNSHISRLFLRAPSVDVTPFHIMCYILLGWKIYNFGPTWVILKWHAMDISFSVHMIVRRGSVTGEKARLQWWGWTLGDASLKREWWYQFIWI